MSPFPWLAPALALAVVSVPRLAVAQDTTTAVPQVYTAATVVRHVRPELAVVTVRFSAGGATPAQAGANVALRADSLRTALQALGIPHDSLISGSQWYWWRGRVQPHQHQQCVPRPDPSTTLGRCFMTYDTTYTVNDAIEIHVRDLALVGAVIDTVLAHRVTDISNVSFRAGDLHDVQEDALREATRRARRQAEAIAEASGATLGRIISLSTQREGGYQPYDFGIVTTAAGYTGEGEGAGTTVVSPSLPVSVTVFGKWVLIAKH